MQQLKMVGDMWCFKLANAASIGSISDEEQCWGTGGFTHIIFVLSPKQFLDHSGAVSTRKVECMGDETSPTAKIPVRIGQPCGCICHLK